ncbi:hypothetical protein CDAR_263491 [Caerostris darwini]|uniref:Uncharacterized protein n=1 Tax=Caerostris darwini TaxID=1538125 RepID=A0AAV4RXT0_9ARAC|nr:hypothetical protein CDAR_263491 [Caerostris darwini]
MLENITSDKSISRPDIFLEIIRHYNDKYIKDAAEPIGKSGNSGIERWALDNAEKCGEGPRLALKREIKTQMGGRKVFAPSSKPEYFLKHLSPTSPVPRPGDGSGIFSGGYGGIFRKECPPRFLPRFYPSHCWEKRRIGPRASTAILFK